MTALGVDFGTTHTVAVLAVGGRPAKPLLFDGSPLLPSAIYADPAGDLLVGRDAEHAGERDPARYEPSPKRHIDEGEILLGDREVPVVEAVAAVLGRVADEAARVAGRRPDQVTLTCPLSWGPRRRAVLASAAAMAGLPAPDVVGEPVAAAAYLVECLGAQVPDGRAVAVYDFGAGTFDVAVVRRGGGTWTVLASGGLADVGGLDVDEALLLRLGAEIEQLDGGVWAGLRAPDGVAARRARLRLWREVHTAKERLARTASTFVTVAELDAEVPVTREALDEAASPLVERTLAETRRVLAESTVDAGDLAAVLLVGGSSRLPLVATMLHRAFGTPPTALEWPELVVAEGALRVRQEQPEPVVVAEPPRVAPPAPPARRVAGGAWRPVAVLAAVPVAIAVAAPGWFGPFGAGVRTLFGPASLVTLAALTLVLGFGRFAGLARLRVMRRPARLGLLAVAGAGGYLGVLVVVAVAIGRDVGAALLFGPAIVAGLGFSVAGVRLATGRRVDDPLGGPRFARTATLGLVAGAALGFATRTRLFDPAVALSAAVDSPSPLAAAGALALFALGALAGLATVPLAASALRPLVRANSRPHEFLAGAAHGLLIVGGAVIAYLALRELRAAPADAVVRWLWEVSWRPVGLALVFTAALGAALVARQR